MKITPLFVGMLVMAGIAVAGCQGASATKSVADNSGTGGSQDPKASEPKTPEQLQEEKDKQTFEGLKHQSEIQDKKQEHIFDIKPGKEAGYTASANSKPPALGDQIDTGMAKVSPTLILAQIEMDDGGAKTTARPMILLKDSKTFALEYVTPEAPQVMGRYVSNEGKAKMLREEKYRDPNVVPVKKWDRRSLDAWLDDISLRMFDTYTTSQGSWSGVLKALSNPANGYKVTTEEKTASINNKSRHMYRIVAKSTSGPQSEVEIVIDGERYVPVTVRRIRTKADGTKLNIFWTGNWQFGGKFAPKSFQVPGS